MAAQQITQSANDRYTQAMWSSHIIGAIDETSKWVQDHDKHLSLLISIFALSISIISLATARFYNKMQLINGVITRTLGFLDEFRKPDFKLMQRHVLIEIKRKKIEDSEFVKRGYRNLDPEDRKAVDAVSYYFDYVGHLSDINQLDKNLFLSILGKPTIDLYDVLKEFITEERKKRDEEQLSGRYMEPYQNGFETIANEAKLFADKKSTQLHKKSWLKKIIN